MSKKILMPAKISIFILFLFTFSLVWYAAVQYKSSPNIYGYATNQEFSDCPILDNIPVCPTGTEPISAPKIGACDGISYMCTVSIPCRRADGIDLTSTIIAVCS